jgi:hypothetical protein
MGPAMNKKHEVARRRLLEEGARSYLDAVNALIAYRKDVQTMCRAVLEKHLDEYASALNVRFDKDDIQDAEWPSLKEWEGDYWILGVKVIRKNITPTIRWWETYCCLEYDSGDEGLYCWIGEWFPTKQLCMKLHRTFHPLSKNVKHDGNQLWIPKDLKVEEVSNLEIHLNGIVHEWIELWRKVGGVKKVFAE